MLAIAVLAGAPLAAANHRPSLSHQAVSSDLAPTTSPSLTPPFPPPPGDIHTYTRGFGSLSGALTIAVNGAYVTNPGATNPFRIYPFTRGECAVQTESGYSTRPIRVQIDRCVLGGEHGAVATSGPRNSGTTLLPYVAAVSPWVFNGTSTGARGPLATRYHVAAYVSARWSDGAVTHYRLLGTGWNNPTCTDMGCHW